MPALCCLIDSADIVASQQGENVPGTHSSCCLLVPFKTQFYEPASLLFLCVQVLTAPSDLRDVAELVYTQLNQTANGQLRRLQALPGNLDLVFQTIAEVSF